MREPPLALARPFLKDSAAYRHAATALTQPTDNMRRLSFLGGSANHGLARSATVRFISDGSGIVVGAITTLLMARVLGPSGVGTFAALTFITMLVVQVGILGLGDAAVVWVGQRKATLQEALSSSSPLLFAAGLGGSLVVLVYSLLQLPVDDPWVGAAVATACVTAVVSVMAQFFIYMIYASQRVVAASLLAMALTLTTMLGVIVFVVVLHLNIFGGTLAVLTANVSVLGAASIGLRRVGLSFWPRLNVSYLKSTLRFGSRALLANVLAYSSARADLLLVYGLSTPTQAGLYSVALTLGTISGFAAIGVSYASFPRLTRMSDRAAQALTAQVARVSLILGTALAIGISILLGAVLSLLLGASFRGALAPAVVLLFGNVLWGAQWLLSRALAARGDPRLLVRSFTLNVVTMICADIPLVLAFGAVGAAIGSVLAPAAGVLLCLRTYNRGGLAVRALIPGLNDLRLVRDLCFRALRLLPWVR